METNYSDLLSDYAKNRFNKNSDEKEKPAVQVK